jgi:hypothetical protein
LTEARSPCPVRAGSGTPLPRVWSPQRTRTTESRLHFPLIKEEALLDAGLPVSSPPAWVDIQHLEATGEGVRLYFSHRGRREAIGEATKNSVPGLRPSGPPGGLVHSREGLPLSLPVAGRRAGAMNEESQHERNRDRDHGRRR